MTKVSILANVHRQDAVNAALNARKILEARGAVVKGERETAAALHIEETNPEEFGNCDLAITFGGDGTLIRAAHWCSKTSAPILGVYYGRFGFVTQCLGEHLEQCLAAFLDGKAKFEERMMLQTDLLRGGRVVATIHSLNETVVQRAVTVRMLTFRVRVDGHELTTYPADGVMVSTPTGSTGYNLSAGGAIMDPGVKALALTALAPHTLSARPLILKPESVIHLSMETEGEAVLSADAQTRLHLLSGDELVIKKSERVTRLMSVQPDDFLVKLGERLLWSQHLFSESQ